MSFIKIDGHQIYYEILNEEKLLVSNSVLLFLHEGLGSVRQWKDFPEKLCSKLALPGLLYDRYGYGLSDQLKEQRDAGYMHQEAFSFLPHLIQELNITSDLILFGHSDGATIALLYASKYPSKVKAVITEAAHVFVEQISLTGIEDAVRLFQKGTLKQGLEKYHGDNTVSMFYGWADTWLSEEFVHWNIEDDIKSIASPILAIQGENDQYGTLKQVESIVKNANANSLILKNCGHTPHLELKEMVIGNVEKFIKQIIGS